VLLLAVPLADEPVLKRVAILVLENLFESRLRLAAESADLDSVLPDLTAKPQPWQN